MRSFSHIFGIFLVSLATLMLEILISRIFSVTNWYHFSFMAISLAMFGMSFGAIIIHLFPGLFPIEGTDRQLSRTAFLFSIFTILAIGFHANVHMPTDSAILHALSLIIQFGVISIPFVFSGINITLVLTRAGQRLGMVYAADLVGAAIGCIGIVFCISLLGAMDAVIVIGLIGLMACLVYGLETFIKRKTMLGGIAVCAALMLGLPFLSFWEIGYVKGITEKPHLSEYWNSFSRITVTDEFGDLAGEWGLSSNVPPLEIPDQLLVQIDGAAGSKLTQFNGDLQSLEFLKQDQVNFAHHLRNNANVLVVGIGGGEIFYRA